MFEKPGFSAVIPTVVESVANRIRPPHGSWARPQTDEGKVSFNRPGNRRNKGESSLKPGRPNTSSRGSGKAICCGSDSAKDGWRKYMLMKNAETLAMDSDLIFIRMN